MRQLSCRRFWKKKQYIFLQRIPSVPDLRSAWLLLLHCASPRASYLLRVLPPDQVLRYAQVHDGRLWQCFCALLGIPPDQCDRTAANSSTLPLSLGDLGLRRAVRTSAPAYWASWADTLPMIHQRHPVVVEAMVSWLNRQIDVPCLRAAAVAADQLTGVDGFSPPSWEALAAGARPPPHEPDDNEPGCSRFGWQHEASSRVERQFRELLLSVTSDSEKAMLRSQGGCGAGAAFSTSPNCALNHLSSALCSCVACASLSL